ncbi:zincin-like metallopeptidase domain-containing protein [Paludisphaera sp.]|uniref:ArdC family protein n=1 Tax=Paludisphaera sp. TaxID=2017432 RepID=UPI00301C93B4
MTANDLYAQTTARIVEALEGGGLPIWRKPWDAGGGFLPLRHTGEPYRGCNTFILAIEAMAKGYSSPFWLTFNQAKAFRGTVRKGEKSTAILFCQPYHKKTTAEDGAEAEASYWLSRTYRVFCADQVDGLPERFHPKPTARLDDSERIAHADSFIANTKATILTGAGAFYSPATDNITLPPFESFESPEAYAATALHEISHWTGAPHRLNRDLSGFKDKEKYATEEIIAELASVLTCAALDIELPDLGQHAAYLGHWIQAMKADPKYLFTAASKAQAAADYLFALQPSPA